MHAVRVDEVEEVTAADKKVHTTSIHYSIPQPTNNLALSGNSQFIYAAAESSKTTSNYRPWPVAPPTTAPLVSSYQLQRTAHYLL